MKKLLNCLLTVIFILTVFIVPVMADVVDPDIPDSWYKPLKTASEMGIDNFKQAPMFDDFDLPPVAERLPVDPPVIEPYEEVGKYGGKVTLYGTYLGMWTDISWFDTAETAGRVSPDGSKMLPLFLKDWEFSDDYKEITLYLREGVKWSDGEPFTTDDYMFWWDHVAHHELLTPLPPEEWNPAPIVDMIQKGPYEITIVYGNSNPLQPVFNYQHSMGLETWRNIIMPAHYMKKFHPDFVDEAKLNKMAEEVGVESWDQLYDRVRWNSPEHPEYKYVRPMLSSYIPVERTETTLVMERNPYFPFVDTEGNQLPYIDRVQLNVANSEEMIATKAVTGESTFTVTTKTSDIPLYKKNESKEDYSTYIYRVAYGAVVGIQPNVTHQDPKKREIFGDARFRKALSLAIDRDNINKKCYFGQAIPRQLSPVPSSKYYKDKYGNNYSDFKPEEAKKLLDKMGLKDVDGDGYRERPDGKAFNPTYMYCNASGVNVDKVLELVVQDWKAIGINVNLKLVERSLHDARIEENNFDISSWNGLVMPLAIGSAHMGKYYAPIGNPHLSPWPAWSLWYMNDGEKGEEPSAIAKEAIKWAEKIATATSEEARMEAAEKLMDIHAENLWVIGTVGLTPKPIIASNSLKNVPKSGFTGWSVRDPRPYFPAQFYLDE